MSIISHCTQETLRSAATALREGHLVVFPTETVYGLGADAENESAVRRIYEVKGRPLDHPVIVHIGDLKYLEYWISELPDYALALARKFWPGPMTLILPRSEKARVFITGGQESVGVRIPSHPLALQLLQEFHQQDGHGVAAPSANLFGAVSPTTSQAAERGIGSRLSISDLILDGGPCVVGIESTIIDCRGERPKVLRPGGIFSASIEQVIHLELDQNSLDIRVSGSLDSHYSPRARVIVGQNAIPGAGFVALAGVPTPAQMKRILAPNSVEEYARNLYRALLEVDERGLEAVVIIPPDGEDLAAAIRDRIERARTKLGHD